MPFRKAHYQICDWAGHWKQLDDDYLVYQKGTGNLYELNQLALEILNILLESSASLDELGIKLSAQFDAPSMDALIPAILNTLYELESVDLVESEI